MIYETPNVATQFVHSLVNKMNAFGVKILFTVLDGEKEKPLIKACSELRNRLLFFAKK